MELRKLVSQTVINLLILILTGSPIALAICRNNLCFINMNKGMVNNVISQIITTLGSVNLIEYPMTLAWCHTNLSLVKIK